MLRTALLAALLIAPAASAAEEELKTVTRCPRKTKPVRTADARIPWACALTSERYSAGVDCPSGHHSVTTTDRYDPFKCAVSGIRLEQPRGICPPGHRAIPTSDPSKDYDCERVKPGFLSGPRCPKGTRPVPTPGELRPFRCLPRKKGLDGRRRRPGKRQSDRASRSPDKKGRCPKGMKKIQVEDPFEPFQCVPRNSGPKRLGRYKRYRIRKTLSFEYPLSWHITNAWKDEVPSIYMLLDTGRGKPVSMTISRQDRSNPSFQEMEEMMRREKEWRGARSSGYGNVGGLRAVYLNVPNESDVAFVPSGDGYFVISYSAPAEYYGRYAAAYHRLLDSFRLLGKAYR